MKAPIRWAMNVMPDDAAARDKLRQYFDDSASSQISHNQVIRVNERDIQTHAVAKGIAWFQFEDICDGPRSQNDYIEIARWYQTVIISNIPELNSELDNSARRFISLVDEFYDRRVKLLVSAATGVDRLYSGSRLSFEYQRTASRLTEMQSAQYLHEAHIA